MLSIGDKVVYPMYGAGTIEAIEEHEVLGTTQPYYILTIPYGSMKVMIPLHKAASLGIRSIISEQDVQKVADILVEIPEPDVAGWNRRIHANIEKMRTGSIFSVAQVLKMLFVREHAKRLSALERRMLDNARQILVSELVMVFGKDEADVVAWVYDLCKKNTPEC